MLDFSKIEAGKLDMEEVEFQLEDVLDNLSSLISLKAEEKGLEFLFDVERQTPNYLMGDPLRLGQVLINLVNNAVKFTDRGKIIVVLRVLEKDVNRVTLQFSVQDTGIGLTREQRERLFQPFTQAESGTTRKDGGSRAQYQGVCGNLGANDLNGASISLEKALKVGDRVLIDNQIHKFEIDLETVLQSINDAAPAKPAIKDDGRCQASCRLNIQKLS